MPGRLQDRVAVITGAASGIGEATVRRFVEEDQAYEVVGDRNHMFVAMGSQLEQGRVAPG